ncbi:MAG: hypothetical protein IPN68_00830 [Bacteroidetes bacterium]|nr:hypothetical protein [Bacteroidota bacterium]
MNTKVIIIFSFSILYGLFEIFHEQEGKVKEKYLNQVTKEAFGYLSLLFQPDIGCLYYCVNKTGRIYHWNALLSLDQLAAAIGLIVRVTSILKLKQYFTILDKN